jgi:hypothetical protein
VVCNQQLQGDKVGSPGIRHLIDVTSFLDKMTLVVLRNVVKIKQWFYKTLPEISDKTKRHIWYTHTHTIYIG